MYVGDLRIGIHAAKVICPGTLSSPRPNELTAKGTEGAKARNAGAVECTPPFVACFLVVVERCFHALILCLRAICKPAIIGAVKAKHGLTGLFFSPFLIVVAGRLGDERQDEEEDDRRNIGNGERESPTPVAIRVRHAIADR